MKKTMLFLLMAACLAAGTTSCSSDDPFDDSDWNTGNNDDNDNTGGNSGGNTGGTTTLGAGDVSTFTVAIDKTSAEPSNAATATYPDEEDDINNNSFATVVNIAFNGNDATYDTVDGVTISNDGGHVTANHGSTKVCYVVSGSTSAGSLTIAGEKKYKLMLNGVSITNPDSTAINLLSKKRAYIVLADGTTNTLKDGSSSKAEGQKAAFYCKGKMLFSGSGSLEVYGSYNNAIHCADYIVFSTGNNIYAKSTANHGIKANDGVYINGGIINVEVTAEAAKGINCESHVVINGGRTTVITTGNGTYDTDDNEAKGAAGIKADSTFTMNGGEFYAKSSGSGGKGLKVDQTATINGGTIRIITTGGQYSKNNDTASPKGIKVDGNLTINDGDIMVRTSGKNGEGIESKAVMTINGGAVSVSAYDDALNSKSHMYLKGGYVFAHSSTNDGIDANGNLYVQGGVVYAIGASSPEVALDANTEQNYKLYITGGTVIAISNIESGASLSQSCYSASSYKAGTWYALYNNGSLAVAFKTPSSGGSKLIVSTSSTPTLKSGVTLSGGSSCLGGMGYIDSSVSNGSSVSLSAYTGSGGGMPGGGGRR